MVSARFLVPRVVFRWSPGSVDGTEHQTRNTGHETQKTSGVNRPLRIIRVTVALRHLGTETVKPGAHFLARGGAPATIHLRRMGRGRLNR